MQSGWRSVATRMTDDGCVRGILYERTDTLECTALAPMPFARRAFSKRPRVSLPIPHLMPHRPLGNDALGRADEQGKPNHILGQVL